LRFVKKYWIVIFQSVFVEIEMGLNNLKRFREEIMLSKAELARKAKVSSDQGRVA